MSICILYNFSSSKSNKYFGPLTVKCIKIYKVVVKILSFKIQQKLMISFKIKFTFAYTIDPPNKNPPKTKSRGTKTHLHIHLKPSQPSYLNLFLLYQYYRLNVCRLRDGKANLSHHFESFFY